MFHTARFVACLVTLLLLASAGGAFAQNPGDSVDLNLEKDQQGGADLQWTGGAPTFEIYRSAKPSAVLGPDTLLARTLDPRYIDYDVPPPGVAYYYHIDSASNCFEATADAYSTSLEPDFPSGDKPTLVVGNVQAEGRAYLRFQLDTIPPGSTINGATLWVEQSSSAYGDSYVTLRRPLGPWAENTLSYNTEPGPDAEYGTPLQPAGAGRRSWNATVLVQEWSSGLIPEFGLVLEASPNWGSAEVTYVSREGGPNTVPRLCVDWTDPLATLGDMIWEDSNTTPVMHFEGDMLATLEVEIPVVATDPVDAGLEFLNRYRGLYDLTDPYEQLFLDRLVVDGTSWSVTFGVRRDNHRVRGEQILVVYDNGVVRRTSTFARPDKYAEGGVVQSPQKAEAVALGALSELQNGGVMGVPSLEWFHTNLYGDPDPFPFAPEPSRLAYRVTVHGMRNGEATFWTVHVDAETGDVLRIFLVDQTGDRPDENIRIMDVGTTQSNTCWWLPWENDDVEWFDENGATGYPGAGSDSFSDGITASNAVHDTYHYLYDNLGRRSWHGEGGAIRVFTHVGVDWNNARYLDFCGQIQFGNGWVTRDILAHEFGHGVVSNTADLVYEFQSGALNESFADWLGALVDGNFVMGEDIEGGTWGAIRDMSNPPAKGDPDHVDPAISGDGVGLRTATYSQCDSSEPDYNDCAFVHSNSGIPNKVAYLIIHGGIHNGILVNSITETKAARLYYDTLRLRLHSSSNFMHHRNETISVAQDHWLAGRLGFTETDVCNVINAFYSVGLGDPDTDCDGYPNPPTSDGDGDGRPDGTDNCPFRGNPWQTDSDADGRGDACDDDMDGDGFVNTGDNCPSVFNPDQFDTDRDGVGDECDDDDGDRILDRDDNCPDVRNSYQEDLDGDGDGDVCDDDDDDDGLYDLVDNCPRAVNYSQTDNDGDGFGNACDNCPIDFNGTQVDTDADGTGDACDDDIDGDGLANTEDNCDRSFNPDQLDPDGNGKGLLCDFEERSNLDGLRLAAELELIFMHEDIGTPIRVPIFPCMDDTCPDRLPTVLDVSVGVEISPAYYMRIIDDTGKVLDQLTPDPDGTGSLRFPTDHDFFYKDGITGTTFKGRQYFLELMAPPNTPAGMVNGFIRVQSSEEQ